MTVRSHARPLTATITERIQATPEIAVLRRRPVLVSPPLNPVPIEPAPTEAPDTMPKKPKKKTRATYTEQYKKDIVKRVMAGRADGSETIKSIAKAEGLYAGNVNNWLKAFKSSWQKTSKKTNGKASKKSSKANGAVPAGDLSTLTAELGEALGRVNAIKKRMRALLGDE